jgi:hypothetical protein
MRRDDGGAVIVLVALGIMFFILGMLALTVDLGRAIGVKRDMVNAADAAAIAAAQQCALGNGPVAAQAAALETAQINGAETEVLFSFEPTTACPDGSAMGGGPKLVHVAYNQVMDYFVAPYIGFDDVTITASATALWALPGVVPITVNVVPLELCNWQDPDPGVECTITYPKNELDNPRWGILDLELWGVDTTDCPVSNSEVVDIIQGGGWPRPPDIPNWDCVDNGAQFASWSELVGGTWWFPVIDVEQSKGEVWPGPGGECTGADIPALQAEGKDCRILTAWVINFVQMRVLSVRIVPGTGGNIELVTQIVPPEEAHKEIKIRLVD